MSAQIVIIIYALCAKKNHTIFNLSVIIKANVENVNYY
jgi:hypothetical protein